MSPSALSHPKFGRRKSDNLAFVLLFGAGFILLLAGVGHALATGARSWGYLEGDASWTDALMSLFYVLAASECFSSNITIWAGAVLRAMAGKLTGTNIELMNVNITPADKEDANIPEGSHDN